MSAVQFDDYSALQQLVSDEFGPWGPSITVTQAMIDQFADLTAMPFS